MNIDENHNIMLPVSEDHENDASYLGYMDMIKRLDQFFLFIGSKIPADNSIIENICTVILQGVREQREKYIGFILGGEVDGYKTAKSSVNTAILSAAIALGLDLPYHKIVQIITGALLHDVGMLRLPVEIINKRGSLTDTERQRMENHPLLAYNIVTKELLLADEVGIVVLQHHERWDAKGYPRRIGGEAIEIGARIVSVADAFEAMVSQKPYRNSMIGHEAMKNLLADNSRRFDPNVLKAFVKITGLHPIGSIVQLNNGVLARVVEIRGEAPLRPTIQVLADEGKTIDLLTEKSLFIAKAMNAKELGCQHP
ncbi:MAG: HD-GYP domain-containing protein [Treponema sp.]|jgi:HD-GYP domain-containing protein (c-di-GMP phosphodiesterase class II)|nr:HD-GYP domain-containing protein [Treponema sp.]